MEPFIAELDPRQREKLRTLARRAGWTQAAVVRQLIELAELKTVSTVGLRQDLLQPEDNDVPPDAA
jgi:predicted DNA-binding protein